MRTNRIATRNWLFAGLIASALCQGVVAQTIAVSNVEELYGKVNDSANVGATLVLAPGTYMLSATDPNGLPRAKGGRLELQRDMALQGVLGDRSLVVINAANLPASSFPASTDGIATGPSAPVRMGLGHNALEWLTVRDGRAAGAGANIDVGLQALDTGMAYVRVAHIASTGSVRGINVVTFGAASVGHTIEADIVDSHFFGNTFGGSEGIRIGNNQGASSATVNVRMSGNLSWGQQIGCLIENNRTIGSGIEVASSGNRFFDNAAGMIILGALSSNNTRADGNTINVEAHGDEFLDNDVAPVLDQGGLFVLGVEDITASAGGSNNTVNVKLWGVRTLGNDGADLAAIGARSLSLATAAHSQNNHVAIEIRGAGNGNGRWQPVKFFADVAPAGPSNGNSVEVMQ